MVFVNIGGISNLTYVDEGGTLIAYDSGPGNMLIDQWMELHGQGSFDPGGITAMSGSVDDVLAARFLDHEFSKETVAARWIAVILSFLQR